jgi:K+-transporting ATPase KdpF subunit
VIMSLESAGLIVLVAGLIVYLIVTLVHPEKF